MTTDTTTKAKKAPKGAIITIEGEMAPKGTKMTKGKGWQLVATSGRKRVFVGTLLETINIGTKRIAIFSVPK
jgi:hypothetical protein